MNNLEIRKLVRNWVFENKERLSKEQNTQFILFEDKEQKEVFDYVFNHLFESNLNLEIVEFLIRSELSNYMEYDVS